MEKYSFPNGTTPNICIVGAGFSGLTAAIKLKEELKLNSFQVFDENKDVGGTWQVNRYPGVACDVPSHMYSWSFEQNPNWSKAFSSGFEIMDYMRKTANKYDLYRHIKFNSKVLRMEWEEDINQWRVTIFNIAANTHEELLFDFVINGPGLLRVPFYPKEFDAFTGTKVHTAEWNDSIDLENKIVGIVGSGASAVQVIQEIAPKVKELHCYQRKPAWIMPSPQFEFSDWVKLVFRFIPPIMWLWRFFIFLHLEILIRPIFTQGHWVNRLGEWLLKGFIRKQLPANDPKVLQLTPNYTLGCKRLNASSEYYPALGLSHVKIIRDKIDKISGSEIGTENGKSQKLDVLILATGFQVHNYYEPMRMIGRDGIDIMGSWKDEGPTTYYGITTSMAPNHFILLGPNTVLGHNSTLFMIECQVNFVINVLKEFMKRDAKRITVKPAAETEFQEAVAEKMKGTVWVTGNCGPWYSNSRGMVTTLWPWTCTRYWQETRTVDHSKFEYLR